MILDRINRIDKIFFEGYTNFTEFLPLLSDPSKLSSGRTCPPVTKGAGGDFRRL
jgi:hypothetical protein